MATVIIPESFRDKLGWVAGTAYSIDFTIAYAEIGFTFDATYKLFQLDGESVLRKSFSYTVTHPSFHESVCADAREYNETLDNVEVNTPGGYRLRGRHLLSALNGSQASTTPAHNWMQCAATGVWYENSIVRSTADVRLELTPIGCYFPDEAYQMGYDDGLACFAANPPTCTDSATAYYNSGWDAGWADGYCNCPPYEDLYDLGYADGLACTENAPDCSFDDQAVYYEGYDAGYAEGGC